MLVFPNNGDLGTFRILNTVHPFDPTPHATLLWLKGFQRSSKLSHFSHFNTPWMEVIELSPKFGFSQYCASVNENVNIWAQSCDFANRALRWLKVSVDPKLCPMEHFWNESVHRVENCDPQIKVGPMEHFCEWKCPEILQISNLKFPSRHFCEWKCLQAEPTQSSE